MSSFERLDPGMQLALGQAWSSYLGGSLGIGAVATDEAGVVLAVGRNRLNETDPGDDVLAGTSLAHAELNVLAKLPFRAHESVVLYTTLQPCVQCLGAIRLSAVTTVHVLAPDPLFRGVERMRELTPFVSRRWPSIIQRPIDEWAAFALLAPTIHMRSHPTLGATWLAALPGVASLAEDVARDRRFEGIETVTGAAGAVWSRLIDCVDEVARLAVDQPD